MSIDLVAFAIITFGIRSAEAREAPCRAQAKTSSFSRSSAAFHTLSSDDGSRRVRRVGGVSALGGVITKVSAWVEALR